MTRIFDYPTLFTLCCCAGPALLFIVLFISSGLRANPGFIKQEFGGGGSGWPEGTGLEVPSPPPGA